MKDKSKGLILGVVIGTMLTGSTVFAGTNTKLSVVLENVKYMFNGVQKQTSQSIVYNGQLYAPVKNIANGLGENFTYDGKTKTAWIGRKEGSFVYLDDISYARIDGIRKNTINFKNWTNPSGLKFKIAGQQYFHGIGSILSQSYSSGDNINSVDYNLNGKYKKLTGYIGVDDYTKDSDNTGTIVIKGDGQELFRKDGIRGGDVATEISVDITGVLKLQVYFEAAEDYNNHIDLVFAEPKLF
ncbi:NPCBM/NEW2 domain-containing protein [Paenibacillus sp. BR2-3]|uniref:NPCBM/NEW2 domain-containing protein n=1 Tax=Paenibacillus sp. BR2-3 TaxID=3048494 RepID=UPI003977CE5B